MIRGLDHVALAAPMLEEAVARYATLFDLPVAARGEGHGWFALGNTALRIEAAPAAAEPRIASLGFAVQDLDSACRWAERRGLPCQAPPAPWAEGGAAGVRAAVLAPEAANGLTLRLVERRDAWPASAAGGIGLDHVVIRTLNPERSVALFGGRLGLDLRLDRSAPDWNTRFLFFRCGDLVVEVVQKLPAMVEEGPDAPTGLAWRAPDVAATQARLEAAGLPVSPVRIGRKPGTRIFSVRENAALVPTAFIGP